MGNMRRKRRLRDVAMLVVVTGFAVSTSSVALASRCRSSGEHPQALTEGGCVRGTRSGRVDQFLGVPFAEPPEGSLRFAPPAPPSSWSGVLDATTLKSQCAQAGGGDEDCLYLNVYRPKHARPKDRLPVMVWLPGGAFRVGSGSDYDPTAISETNDMIVVTVNHRVGALGFLSLPSLTAESGEAVSGNYGLLDQLEALRWVQRNIQAFGGDAENVTIAGESAGGFSVCYLLASPLATGLFSRAIVQSGGCWTRPFAEAEQKGTAYAELLGCSDSTQAADCLRNKTPSELVGTRGFGDVWPVAGGDYLPVEPLAAIRSGSYNKVPVLLGNVRDEMSAFMRAFYPLGEPFYPVVLSLFYPDIPTEQIVSGYPIGDYVDPFHAFTATLSDNGAAFPIASCLTRDLAVALSSTTETFVYEFDDPEAPTPDFSAIFSESPTATPGPATGASHGTELTYLFKLGGQTQQFGLGEPTSPAQKALSRVMVQYWGNFAECGDPNGSGPGWPEYEFPSERAMQLEPSAVEVLDDFSARHRCEFWESFGLLEKYTAENGS